MKKMFPLALLLCVLFSMSSFAPVHHTVTAIKKAKTNFAISWPLTGTIASSYSYEIGGNGNTPNSVTIYKNGTLVSSYLFEVVTVGSSYSEYVADGMSDPTNGDITAFQLIIYNNGDYRLNIYSI